MKKFVFALLAFCAIGLYAQDLILDLKNSKLEFIGSKFGGMSVKGEFKKFSGDVIVSNGEIKVLRGVVQASSVDSQSKKRDENIRGAKLLESDKFPEFSFQMQQYDALENHKGKVKGVLDLHGQKKQITLDSEILENQNGAVLRLKGEIDIQKDFGMKSYAMMSNKVRINVSLALK